MKINTEKVLKGIGVVGGVILAGVVACCCEQTHIDEFHTCDDSGFSEAVDAIMNSGMWSSDKQKAISAMKSGCSYDIYAAVIKIAESQTTWSSDKVKMIEKLFS